MLHAVIIGGLVSEKVLLFLIPVDFSAFREKDQDLLADNHPSNHQLIDIYIDVIFQKSLMPFLIF